MKSKFALAAGIAALPLLSVSANAAGLDVVRQSYDILYEKGTVLQTTVTSVNPDTSGTIAGIPTGNVGPGYFTGSVGIKTDVNDLFSLAFIIDRPYYNEVSFPKALGSVYGRYATDEATGLVRYKFAENWSIFGGVRLARFQGETSTSTGTSFNLDAGYGVGYTLGMAFEVPDFGILARVAYKSPIKFSLKGAGSTVVATGLASPATIQFPLNGTYDIDLPQSVMFDVRVPVNEKNFLLGSVTWNDWSATQVKIYQNLGSGVSATNYNNNWVFNIGAGHFLTDDLIVSGSFSYDTGTGKVPGYDTVYGDQKTFALALTYLQEKYRITGAVGYTLFGDTKGNNTGITPGASIPVSYSDNTAITAQLQLTYKF